MSVDRPPKGVVWVAGASGGVFVVAFMVIPWPSDLLVVPALLVWSLLLSGFCPPKRWKQPGPVVALLGFCALVLGGVLGGLLYMVS